MTQEDKQLLLKDLAARLPYGVKMRYKDDSGYEVLCQIDVFYKDVDGFRCLLRTSGPFGGFKDLNELKPYLRPMSSMTYEEMQDAREKFFDGSDHYDIDGTGEIYADTYQPYTSIYTLSFARLSGYIDWLNEHHLDYRGLIERGLAIEAPEGMYKTE